MTDIEIYTTKFCGYCTAAKRLLKNKGVEWNEIDVTFNRGLRDEMVQRAGGLRTVPQIFINGEHIGGFSDLSALDGEGKLNEKLGLSN